MGVRRGREGEGSSSRGAEVSVGGEGGWDRSLLETPEREGLARGGSGSSSGSPRCAALMPQHPEAVPSTGGTQKMPAGVTQEGGAGAGGGLHPVASLPPLLCALLPRLPAELLLQCLQFPFPLLQQLLQMLGLLLGLLEPMSQALGGGR